MANVTSHNEPFYARSARRLSRLRTPSPHPLKKPIMPPTFMCRWLLLTAEEMTSSGRCNNAALVEAAGSVEGAQSGVFLVCCEDAEAPAWTHWSHGLAHAATGQRFSSLPPLTPHCHPQWPRNLSAPGSAFHLNTFSSQKFHFNLTSSLHTTLTPGNCLPNDPIKL